MNAARNIAGARAAEAQHLLQVYGQLDIEPDGASGVHVHCGGRRILDLYGGHAVAALGYGHPDLLEVLGNQAETLFFQSNAVALTVRAKAADRLVEFAPQGLNRVFFANSGAEANENALRLALRSTGRSRVVALEHGFHGRTAAAATVTWGAREKWFGFPRAPFDVCFVPRDRPEDAAGAIGDDTAAVILELVQGVAGAYDLSTEFVSAIVSACRNAGALLIVDEVQTGVGRTGAPFAADLYELSPDILTTAKALGGGFPVSAMLCTEAVAASVAGGDLGTTFGGGPMACAIASKILEVIERDQLLQNVQHQSARLREAMPLGPVTSVQGHGFLMGLVCTRPASEVRDDLLQRDILVGTSADPNVIRLLPPLTLDSQHVDQFVLTLGELT